MTWQPLREEIGDIQERIENGPIATVRVVQYREKWDGPLVELEIRNEAELLTPAEAELLADRLPDLLRAAAERTRGLRGERLD